MRDPVKRAAFIKEHFPDPVFDKTPPALPPGLKPGGVLIFSKTNGFRDTPAIEASNAALAAIAGRRAWPFFQTENGAVMNPEALSHFKLVVWNNTSGDTLTEDQRAAFRAWVEKGGSVFGIHGAGGDPTSSSSPLFAPPRSAAAWHWYVDTLLGAQFVVHSPIVPATIHIENRQSAITKGLPEVWRRSDEWYAFQETLGRNPASTSWRPWTKRVTSPARLPWVRTILSSGGIVSAEDMPSTQRWPMPLMRMPNP